MHHTEMLDKYFYREADTEPPKITKFKVHTNPDYLLIESLGPVHCLRGDFLKLWEQLDDLFRGSLVSSRHPEKEGRLSCGGLGLQ